MTQCNGGSTPFTQRVEVGAYYTDGESVWEVMDVCDLGSVDLRNIANERERAMGIDVFRREMWLVAGAAALPGERAR